MPRLSLRRRFIRALFAASLCSLVLPSTAVAAERVMLGARDLQEAIDALPAHATLVCDPARNLTIEKTVQITRPLTLEGLTASLPAGLGSTPLLIVRAPGVSLVNLHLIGNCDSVPQDQRAALVVIAAGDFRVERARFINSSKDGINIDADSAGTDIIGGVIRDIVGQRVIRDTVSIGGGDALQYKVRHVVVDNVRAYDSRLRGAVEVSDGSEHITVRTVYAERCVYAVDVQDHIKPHQINRHILVEDVRAVHCRHALRTANRPLGHVGLTVRNVVAEDCPQPIQISNTRGLWLENIHVVGHAGNAPAIALRDCPDATVRNVLIDRSLHAGAAMVLENCDRALVDGLVLTECAAATSALRYSITRSAAFSGVRITHVVAPQAPAPAILLETSATPAATLQPPLLHHNAATARNEIPAPPASNKTGP